MDYVTKRNGQRVPFDISKIVSACRKAFDACGCKMPVSFEELLTENTAWFVAAGEVEKIQDHIEDLLFKSGYQQVFKAFASYRANRALLRENRIKEVFEGIMNLDKNDVTNDNANMNAATPSGQMMKYASESTKAFTRKYLLSKPVKEAMDDNIIYPHDLDFMITRGLNCLVGDTHITIKTSTGEVKYVQMKYLDKYFDNNSGDAQQAKPNEYIWIWGRNGWTRITSISRHALTDQETLYQLKVKKGAPLKVTGNHLIPVIRDNQEILLQVNDIREGDCLIRPTEFCQNDLNNEYLDMISIINNMDFPEKNNLVIRCIGKLRKFLNYKYNISSLSTWLGVQSYPRGVKYIYLEDYNKICDEFDIPYDVIKDLSIGMKQCKETLPLFVPITPELAEVFGYIHSEGSVSFITRTEKRGIYQIVFSNSDQNMIDRFVDSWYRVFDRKPHVSPNQSVWNCVISSKLLALIFRYILGHKDKSFDIKVPDFIMNGSDNIKWHYLSALIDGDGCIKDTASKKISYSSVCRSFVEQISLLLKSLGVESAIYVQHINGRQVYFGDKLSRSHGDMHILSISGYDDISKVLNNLTGIKQQKVDVFFAYTPAKAVKCNPSKITQKIPVLEPGVFVYDIETVEHWFIANGVVVHNCLQLPLDKILQHGFSAGHGEARPAKRIETAATLAAIALQTTQNEMYGGQSIPAFDFYMAPYVRATYVEEVNKIRDLLVDGEASGFWDSIRDAEINDYIVKDLPHNSMPTYGNTGISRERIQQLAINQTVRRVHQAMEGLLHNLNSMHSRGRLFTAA